MQAGKKLVKKHGRSSWKSAVLCTGTQIVSNTSSCLTTWVQQTLNECIFFSFLAWTEHCANVKTAPTSLQMCSESKRYYLQDQNYSPWAGKKWNITGAMESGVGDSPLEKGWKMELMGLVLLPVENGFTYKDICVFPTKPFLRWTAPVPHRSSCPCQLLCRYVGEITKQADRKHRLKCPC